MSENLEVRPIEPDDVEALRRMFYRLSPETVYRRFFRPIRDPSPKVLEYLAHVDHDRRDALVAVVDGEIVAVARYDRVAGTDDAEVAVVVEDAWQGRGLGRRLMAKLSYLAQARGVTAFTATMLGDNRAASGLMRSVAHHPDVHVESGELVMRAALGRRVTPSDWNERGAASLPGLVGIEVLDVAHGRARMRLPVRPDLLAPNGYLHAAAVIALADTAAGYGCVESLPEGAAGFTTIELKSNFLGTLTEGALACEASLVHGGRTTQLWDAVVTDEATGRTIALFRCTQLVLQPRG